MYLDISHRCGGNYGIDRNTCWNCFCYKAILNIGLLQHVYGASFYIYTWILAGNYVDASFFPPAWIAAGYRSRKLAKLYVLRNAMLPVVTVIGINFAIMMGGAIVTESVFALPGVGTLLITSVRMKDIPVVMAVVMFVAIVIGIINLIVDLAYAYIDPRIKTKYSAHKRGK